MNHDKYFVKDIEKSKPAVTTYKPKISLKDLQEPIFDEIVAHKFAEVETQTQQNTQETVVNDEDQTTLASTTLNVNPGEMDLGTGSPDPTIIDLIYTTPTTESTSEHDNLSFLDRSDGFSFMDYFFGVTSSDDNKTVDDLKNLDSKPTETPVTVLDTEEKNNNITTSERSYISKEITTISDEETEKLTTEFEDIQKVKTTESPKETNLKAGESEVSENPKEVNTVETSSMSSFLDPNNVVSTSKSTEISHETEICFRGKCIKASNDLI